MPPPWGASTPAQTTTQPCKRHLSFWRGLPGFRFSTVGYLDSLQSCPGIRLLHDTNLYNGRYKTSHVDDAWLTEPGTIISNSHLSMFPNFSRRAVPTGPTTRNGVEVLGLNYGNPPPPTIDFTSYNTESAIRLSWLLSPIQRAEDGGHHWHHYKTRHLCEDRETIRRIRFDGAAMQSMVLNISVGTQTLARPQLRQLT